MAVDISVDCPYPVPDAEGPSSSVAYAFADGTKFATIHLGHCVVTGLPATMTFRNSLSAHMDAVIDLSDVDVKRIGSDYAGAFRKGSLVLMASMPSATPEILDRESHELNVRVHMFFASLLMFGVPNYWPGILAIGGKGRGDARAQSYTPLDRYYPHVRPKPITAETLRSAAALVPGIMTVFGSADFKRLSRGINTLIVAWKASSLLDKLQAFVRALDALMKLEQNAGERQFVERMRMFAIGMNLDTISREVYRLRSFNEHLSDWPSKLAYIKRANHREFVSRRAFEVEVLAEATYRTLLSNAALLESFKDVKIDALWSGGQEALMPQIDLDAHAARFEYRKDD